MGQLNTHEMEAEAQAAVQRDINRRESHRKAAEAAKKAAEDARGRPWAKTLEELQKQDARIKSSMVAALGALHAASKRHIELQQSAAQLAAAHHQPNPINATLWGDNVPSTAEFYIIRLLERAVKAIKSGAGLTKDGMSQP